MLRIYRRGVVQRLVDGPVWIGMGELKMIGMPNRIT